MQKAIIHYTLKTGRLFENVDSILNISHGVSHSEIKLGVVRSDIRKELGHLLTIRNCPRAWTLAFFFKFWSQCKDVGSYSTCQRHIFPMGTLV